MKVSRGGGGYAWVLKFVRTLLETWHMRGWALPTAVMMGRGELFSEAGVLGRC